MTKIASEHIRVLQVLQNDRKWSRQKVKSIRGQILAMPTFAQREEYLKRIIKGGA